MESLPAGEEVPMGTVTSDDAPKEEPEAVENDTDNTDAPTAKKVKLDEAESALVEKKRRGGYQKHKKIDTTLMEEARAAYGELDASEGRRLRKRPEPKQPPPKKASPKQPSTSKRGRKKKVVEEEVKEEDEAKPEDNKEEESGNEPAAKPADDTTDDTTEHDTADVKETPEESASAEMKDDEPPVTTQSEQRPESEPSLSTEPSVATESVASAAEVVMASEKPEQAEEQKTPTPTTMEQPELTTESSAVSSAAVSSE